MFNETVQELTRKRVSQLASCIFCITRDPHEEHLTPKVFELVFHYMPLKNVNEQEFRKCLKSLLLDLAERL